MRRVEAKKFLNTDKKESIIDVRSPAEFVKGHIPGAVNIPIFNDLERAKVGTVYKQQSKEEAIALGLEIVGPKMNSFTQLAKKHTLNNQLAVYCWRGGMRSEKMAWLFEVVGLETTVLEGGYKAYRNYMHEFYSQLNSLIIIQGPTGSGKTKILHALRDAGEQVIDLEGLAKHKGSVFGGLGEDGQPTTQQFQNNILAVVEKFDLGKPIWLESESATIGKVYLPETFWRQMNLATILAIEVSREQRIANIVEEYGRFTATELINKVVQLQQRLGGANVKLISQMIGENRLPEAVDLLLDYYDQSYKHSVTTYKINRPKSVVLKSKSPKTNAETLINQLVELIK